MDQQEHWLRGFVESGRVQVFAVGDNMMCTLQPLEQNLRPVENRAINVRVTPTHVQIHEGEAVESLPRDLGGWVDRLAKFVEQERRSIEKLREHGPR